MRVRIEVGILAHGSYEYPGSKFELGWGTIAEVWGAGPHSKGDNLWEQPPEVSSLYSTSRAPSVRLRMHEGSIVIPGRWTRRSTQF